MVALPEAEPVAVVEAEAEAEVAEVEEVAAGAEAAEVEAVVRDHRPPRACSHTGAWCAFPKSR
jgi:hypothetical protein